MIWDLSLLILGLLGGVRQLARQKVKIFTIRYSLFEYISTITCLSVVFNIKSRFCCTCADINWLKSVDTCLSLVSTSSPRWVTSCKADLKYRKKKNYLRCFIQMKNKEGVISKDTGRFLLLQKKIFQISILSRKYTISRP